MVVLILLIVITTRTENHTISPAQNPEALGGSERLAKSKAEGQQFQEPRAVFVWYKIR